MNIFEEADSIINDRNQEKERQYGPIDDGLKSTANIASEITGKDITIDDVYAVMISLKLSRIRYMKKKDSFLDLIAYAGAWFNFNDNSNGI